MSPQVQVWRNAVGILLVLAFALVGCDGIHLEPERQLASIEIEPKDTLILEGSQAHLRLVARDQSGEVIEIPKWRLPLWDTDDFEIIRLMEHRVDGVGGGEGLVTVSLAGLSASTTVSVNPQWDVAASSAYITQIAQNPHEQFPLVANRKGLLRIFLTLDGFHRHDPPEVRVVLRQFSGVPFVDTVVTQAFPEVMTEMDESSLAYSYNLLIPAEHMKPGLLSRIIYDPEDRVRGVQGEEMFGFKVVELLVFKQLLVPVISTLSPENDWSGRGREFNGEPASWRRNEPLRDRQQHPDG